MASFAEILYALPTERLRQITLRRGVEPRRLAMIPDKRQLAQHLSNELARAASLNKALMQCNARELRLIQMLVSLDGSLVPWHKLLALAGDERLRPALESVVAGLEENGLAFRTPKGVYLTPNLQQQIPVSLSDRYTVERSLNQYDAPSVKKIIQNLGLRPQKDTKPGNISAIETFLLHASSERLSGLVDDDERMTMEYLATVGGSAPVQEVANAVLQDVSDFYRYDWQNRWRYGKERNAIDRLLGKGFLYVGSQGYGYYLFLYIPGDFLRALMGATEGEFWTEPAPQPERLEAPPTRAAKHSSLVRDVVFFLGSLSAQEVQRTNTGLIHKTHLKNAARSLSLPEESYAGFIYALCREAGYIETQGEKQVYALSAKGNRWLHWDSVTQTRVLFETWRNSILWAEMYNDPLAKSNSYRPKDTILAMRGLALELIAQAPETEFCDLDSVTSALAFRAPMLLAQSGKMGNDLAPSPTVFLQTLTGDALFWLGMVELGLAPAPTEGETATPAKPTKGRGAKAAPDPAQEVIYELAGYRLTPLGRALLGLPEASLPEMEPTEDKFILQANAEIFLPPYLAPPILYQLLAVTALPTKGGSGGVSLTRESIRRALDQGKSVRELLAFLQAHSRTGIPQNVEYLVNEVGGKHGHIHVGAAQMYLQVDSPILLKELQARKELKPFFVRALSDTIALVRSEDPEKMLRELRKAGYLPVSDDDPRKENYRATTAKPPPEAPLSPAQAKESKQAAKLESALNWERIAQDDGKPWDAFAAMTPRTPVPLGAVNQSTMIRTLLERGMRTRTRIELYYNNQGEPGETLYLLEPNGMYSNFVNGMDALTETSVSLNIQRIIWARPTDETFNL